MYLYPTSRFLNFVLILSKMAIPGFMAYNINNIMQLVIDNNDHRKQILNKRRLLREENRVFELPDWQFKHTFRLTKGSFEVLYNILRPHLMEGTRRGSISVRTKILITLRFLAQGSYQKGIGNDINLAVGRSTVSEILSDVLNKMHEHFCPFYVRFPTLEGQIRNISQRIQNDHCISGVVGFIDGTHISVAKQAIRKDVEHRYLNRKGFHSMNVQIIVDDRYRILSLNAKYGGSTHDSFIWDVSLIRDHIADHFNNRNLWLLGDSGYPLEPWLLVPFRNPATPGEELFNHFHKSLRSTVERSIGVLKSRWRCLKSERGLYYSPSKCVKIINACAALHNLCIEMDGEHYLQVEPEIDEEIPQPPAVQNNVELLQRGEANRQFVIENLIVG